MSRYAVLVAMTVLSAVLPVLGQASRESRPALPANPLDLMALPPPPEGVRIARQPVVTIDRDKLETDDFAREIVAFHWQTAVETLVRRAVLEVEIAEKKITIGEADIEQEAVRILSTLDPAAAWGDVAMTSPGLAHDLRAQARDGLGWSRVNRPADADEAESDARVFLRAMDSKKALERYKIRKRESGDDLPAGIAADVVAPSGRVDAIPNTAVLDYLRHALRHEDLVAARESLIDDYLLGRDLAATHQSVSADEISKTVAEISAKHKAPFDWKMICQFKGTTPAKETAMFRRLAAWKKVTGFRTLPEDLAAFVKERGDYFRGECRNVSQILFRTVDALGGAPLESTFQEQAEAQARETYAALRKGADFSETARARSEDSPSAARGGGAAQPFKRFDPNMDQALIDAVFALTPDSPLSKPVKGPKGWYLFKLDKVTPPRDKTDLADPKLADWIKDDFERVHLAVYLAAARKKAAIGVGPDTVLTSGW